jgi:hypothetical protein
MTTATKNLGASLTRPYPRTDRIARGRIRTFRRARFGGAFGEYASSSRNQVDQPAALLEFAERDEQWAHERELERVAERLRLR